MPLCGDEDDAGWRRGPVVSPELCVRSEGTGALSALPVWGIVPCFCPGTQARGAGSAGRLGCHRCGAAAAIW